MLLLGLTLLVGVLGYRYIADYAWVDAMYMTVITITTVGFSEVTPLNTEAKIFTIILILCSIIIVGYALTVITEYIVGRSTYYRLKRKQVQKRINGLTDHIIICGYGRNGKQAAQKLMAYNKPFVIIEKVMRLSIDTVVINSCLSRRIVMKMRC